MTAITLRRSPSPIADDSPSLRPSSFGREVSGRELSLSARKEKVVITCVGMLYSPIIMQSVEGQACPDATHFLMAGTQVCYTHSLDSPITKAVERRTRHTTCETVNCF